MRSENFWKSKLYHKNSEPVGDFNNIGENKTPAIKKDNSWGESDGTNQCVNSVFVGSGIPDPYRMPGRQDRSYPQ